MFADILCIESRPVRCFRSFLLVILSSIFIGLFAKLSIFLPFTPVPITMQPVVILLLSMFLGASRAGSAVLCFLGQGAMGFPVFAGGKGGIVCLLGPTGGYFIGYLLAAILTGYLAERMKERSSWKIFFVLSLGTLTVFLGGVPYLATFIGWQKAFTLGFFPFLFGDLLKICMATKLLQWSGRVKIGGN